MRLTIAGKDRTADLGAELSRRSARLHGALSPWLPQHSALSLRDSRDSSDYFDRFCRLVRLRHEVNTGIFHIPVKPGWLGKHVRQVKTLLWKALRYQHDRITFQQNIINELVVSGVDFQNSAVMRKMAGLERKVEQLESELKALRRGRADGKGAS